MAKIVSISAVHRSHYREIYNSLLDVKLSQDFIAVMMELRRRPQRASRQCRGPTDGADNDPRRVEAPQHAAR